MLVPRSCEAVFVAESVTLGSEMSAFGARYFETCRRLIGLYGGTVEKFIGEDRPACSLAGDRSHRGARRRLRGVRLRHAQRPLNRLRRASADTAIVIAASIFLDIFNVFLLLLDLFGGARD
jgi:hypothetical protein